MRDYVLLLFVIGLVPFMLWRSWIGALGWTWIGLMNPHLYAWTLRTFPFAQLIGIAFLVGWLFDRRKRGIPLTPGTIFMLALLVWVTVKMPFAWNPESASWHWNQYVKIVLGVLLISTVIYSAQRVQWYLWTVIVSLGIAYGVKGGLDALATGGEYTIQGPEPSFIGGNTHLAVALIMVMPLFLAFARLTDRKWLRIGAYASFSITLIAVIFTYSRGAWLGLGAIAPFLFWQAKRKLLILAALVPIAILGVSMMPNKVFDRAGTIENYEEDASAMQRIQGWGVAFNVAKTHVFGAGFVLDATPVDKWMSYANFTRPDFRRANAAHSIYFQLLGDHGFIGLGLFLGILTTTMFTLWRVSRVTAGKEVVGWISPYANALLIGLVGYTVSGAFVSLGYFDLFYVYVVMAGIFVREIKDAAADVGANVPVKATVRSGSESVRPRAAVTTAMQGHRGHSG